MAEITEQQKHDIYNGKLQIYANIMFDPVLREQLVSFLREIAPDGDTRYLSKRDYLFRYDKERRYWGGSHNRGDFDRPHVRLEHNFTEPYKRIVDICKLYNHDIKCSVINSISSKSNEIFEHHMIGKKVPNEIAGHLRAAGYNATMTPSGLRIKLTK